MAFCTFSKEYNTTAFTSVENVFIYAYMPEADEKSIKIYLYGLYLCQKSEQFSLKEMAEALNETEQSIIDSFKYWEEFGVLDVISEEPFMVNYLPIGYTGAKPRKINAEKYTEFNHSVQKIISGRMISTNEYSEYFKLIEDYGIKQEAMLMIVQYCVDIKGDDIGYKYISTVAKDFASRGITTPEKVEKELENYIVRSKEIVQILTALKQTRKAEIEDVKLFAKWTGEMGFELPSIIAAASTIKRGSIKKLDELMGELYAGKIFSVKEITEFSKSKKYAFELAAKINKELSVYCEVIDPVVDNYTSRWLSLGFNEDALLLVANYCFKRGRRSLESMDKTLENLHQKGVVDFDSIVDYFKEISQNDEFLKKLLESTGQSRRPNEWDRQNLRVWRGWGFTDEMIEKAAAVSLNKSSPIVYMNSVLSNWKNKGWFSPEDVILNGDFGKETTFNANQNKEKSYGFSNQRNYTKEELDALVTDVDDIDI